MRKDRLLKKCVSYLLISALCMGNVQPAMAEVDVDIILEQEEELEEIIIEEEMSDSEIAPLETKQEDVDVLIEEIIEVEECIVEDTVALAAQEDEEIVASGECGDDATWTLAVDGILTVSGSGSISCAWTDYKDSIVEVVIEDGITEIGVRSFSDCENLCKISLSNQVNKICTYAFSNCPNLKEVIIPENVNCIDVRAFGDCKNLVTVTFLAKEADIDEYAFIATGITTIKGYADSTAELFATENGYEFVLLESKNNESESESESKSEISDDYEIENGSEAGSESETAFEIVATGECGSAAVWTLDETGLLTISGTSGVNCGWDVYKEDIQRVVINEGITAIGRDAFKECSNLISIKIPDGVTKIGYNAFSYCTNLEMVSIPESVMTISGYAFYKCDNLKTVEISSNISTISQNAFSNCSSLMSVTIPESVTNIEYSAFQNCSSLTSIVIPDGVINIGNSAFSGCKSLTSIVIPEGVTSIGSSTFSGCKSLTSIVIPEGVTSIGSYSLSGCSNLTTITIPEKVTTIGDGAFNRCNRLVSITVPEGVTSIGSFTFSGCSGLASIAIPEGVTSIGDSAFSDCSGLASIAIPEGVTSIGDSAFFGCSGLSSVTVPEGVTSIGRYIFSGCSNLVTIILPEGITTIGDSAFSSCESLTSIVIPEGVTSIGSSTFSGCKSLTSIIIPEGVTSIVDDTFWGCSGLETITIPESLECIGEYAFYGCESLVAITIPEKVTTIGTDAFNCSSLVISCYKGSYAEQYAEEKSIAYFWINENGRLITPSRVCGDNAKWILDGNGMLTISGTGTIEYGWGVYIGLIVAVTIEEKVTSIADFAFNGCNSLTAITIPKSVEEIGDYAFLGSNIEKIYGYFGSVAESFALENGYEFVSLDAEENESENESESESDSESKTEISATGECGDDAVWTFDSNGLLKISGEGTLEWGWDELDTDEVTEVIIEQGITEIDYGTFEMFSNLKSVTIPEGVTSIGSSAFYKCSSLSAINIPTSVVDIGSFAFAWCTSLTEIVIPEGVKCIEDRSFDYCSNLKSIELPDSVTSIGSDAFSCCFKLSSIEIPENVTSIGESAFMSCTGLTSMVIPEGVNVITEYTFYNCTGLSSVTIPESVLEIEAYAFCGCTGLEEITILNNVESIDKYAFWGTGLVKIYGYSDTMAEIYAEENEYKFIDIELGEVDPDEEPDTVAGGLNGKYGIYYVGETGIRVYYVSFDEAGTAVVGNTMYTMDESNAYDTDYFINYNGNIYYYSGESGMNYTYHVTDAEIVVTWGTTKLIKLTEAEDGYLSVTYSQLTEGHERFNVGDVLGNEISDKNTKFVGEDAGTEDENVEVSNAEDIINDLPEISGLTVDDAAQVYEARAAYDALTEEQKAQISSETLAKLEAAEARIAELKHVHSWGTGTVTKVAACIEAGIKTYKCTTDGCTGTKTETIAATGHTAGSWTQTKAATCAETGTKVQKCSVCQTVLNTQTIAKTAAHKYGSWTTVSEATVSAAKVQKHTCSVCGKVEQQSTGSKVTPVLEVPGKLSSFNIKKGKTVKFALTMANGDAIKSVTSSAAKYVKVSAVDKKNGQISLKAVKKGTAKITITLTSGKSRTYAVKAVTGTVKTTSLNVTNAENNKLILAAKKTYQLKHEVKPFTTTQKVTYKSSNKKIAKVSSTGKITAVAPGKATITVTSGSKKVKIAVTVQGISIAKSSVSVKKNKTLTLKPKTYGISGRVIYTSSNTAVATVTYAGKVKGIKKGTTKITIKAGNYTKTVTVKVK